MTNPSPAVLAARALGTPIDPGPDWLAYDRAAGAIRDLLREHKGKVFVEGRAPSTVLQAQQLAQTASQLALFLQGRYDEAYRIAYDRDGGPVRALERVTGTDVDDAVERFVRVNTVEHDLHAEAVEAERRARIAAITMRDRVALLVRELKRLNPDAPELGRVGELTDAGDVLFAAHGYAEATAKFSDALDVLAEVRDPFAALSGSDAPDNVVRVIQELRFTIVTSPLRAGSQRRLLKTLSIASDKLLEPDVPGCKRKVELANRNLQKELRRLSTRSKRVQGLVAVGKAGLNALKAVADPGDYIGLEAEFGPWRRATGADTDEEVAELASLVQRIEQARDRYREAFEQAAAGLKKLDGFEGRLALLREWADDLAFPFTFPVPLDALRAGYGELTDAVRGRSIRATQVATDVGNLLGGEQQDQDAKGEMVALLDAITDADERVQAKATGVRLAVQTIVESVERTGVTLEALSEPPEDSAQWFQGCLKELLDGWAAEVSTAWRRKAIDPDPTLRGLALLQGFAEFGVDQDDLVAASKLATALALYRKAHDEALALVGEAVLVQDDGHHLPADKLALIGDVDGDLPAATDAEAVDGLTRRHTQISGDLQRYIRAQKDELARQREHLTSTLDSARDLLTEAVEFSASRPDKAKKQKEQEYAESLLATAVPELRLFVGADVPSLIASAQVRAEALLFDARAMLRFVKGEPARRLAPGRTLSVVIDALQAAKDKLDLSDKRVKKYRRATYDLMTEQLDDVDKGMLEQPIGDSLDAIRELREGGGGIDDLYDECTREWSARKRCKIKANKIKRLVNGSDNQRALKAAFTTRELEALDSARIARPDPADGKAWFADTVQRIKDLLALSKPGESPIEADTQLDEVLADVQQALRDRTVVAEGANRLAALERDKAANRDAWELAVEEHRSAADEALARDTSESKLKKAHKAEVAKDFDLAGKAFEASGDLKTCTQMLLLAQQKAERFGLGTEESEAKYALEQLPVHAQAFSDNVVAFNSAVDTALDNLLAAADGTDGAPELSAAGKKQVALVRDRLKRAMNDRFFLRQVSTLQRHLRRGDKRKARSTREFALSVVRRYRSLLEEDPVIVLLAQSPAGGFASASAPLRRTLNMLERTLLVAVPKGV